VSAKTPSRFRHGPIVLLALMLMFYVLVVGGYIGFSLRAEYEETLAQSERTTQDYARLLEEHTLRTLDASDLVVLRLLDRIDPNALSVQAVQESLWRQVRLIIAESPQTETLLVADAEGTVLLDARRYPARSANIAERDYFQALKTETNETFVGKVIKDPESGAYVFTVARRILDENARFRGVVAATIPNTYFQQFYRRLNLGAHHGLGVYKLDGAILVREPLLKEEDINRSMAQNPIYTLHLPKSPIGTYRGKSAYDGVVRVVSYRKLDEPPLLVWVSIAENDALAAWQGRAQRLVALGLASLLVMGLISLLVLRGFRREQAAQTELTVLNASLTRSNSDLEQFAYIASHDLQEPLRMVASYAQLMERRYRGRLDPDADTFISYIVEGAQRMRGMIRELLEYSRVDLNVRPTLMIEPEKALRQALDNLDAMIGASSALIEVGPLPKTALADFNQLVSLFQNLIGNGLKYQAPGNKPIIRIKGEDQETAWQFSIQDNGIGIEPQYFERIFLVFKRLHSRSAYPGDGIGLAHCKRIVERHGGRIWVHSVFGEGSTFHFELPKRPPPLPETPATPE